MKADHVALLARQALDGNRAGVVSAVRILHASEPENSKLRAFLGNMLGRAPSVLQDDVPAALKGSVLALQPNMALENCQIPEGVLRELQDFIEQRACINGLHEAGLDAPHKVLLSGPPGNGKTTLAGALAKALGVPFFVLDYPGVVRSYMGETGASIAKVFRELHGRQVVLFVDEMETLLTERNSSDSGRGDVGEISRVVSTMLVEIDRLPDSVILIGATNHEEMLDRAVLRRFDHKWDLPAPDTDAVSAWLERFAARYPGLPILDRMPRSDLRGRSFSDLEREVLRWCRKWVVSNAGQANVSGALKR